MNARGPSSTRITRLARRFIADVRGATAVEYGLIVTLIVIASIAAFIQLAGTTSDLWKDVNNKVTAAR